MSPYSPLKVRQLISTLLSSVSFVGGGVEGSASDRQSAHRQSTFQLVIPVRRLSVISWSRACCETRTCSSGMGGSLPEEVTPNMGGVAGGAELKDVLTSDVFT